MRRRRVPVFRAAIPDKPGREGNEPAGGIGHDDDERFWPIFERAQALDVPIYVHPAPPHPGVIELYYAKRLLRM